MQEQSSSVVVFGVWSDLTASMVTALRRHGVDVIEGPAPSGAANQARVDSRAAESLILVIDEHRAMSLFAARHSCRSRSRIRACENDACDLAVTTALDAGARRILVICDVRRLTFGQCARALGLVRRVAQRIGYECAINGLRPVASSYAVVDVDDVARAAAAVVRWHRREVPVGASPYTRQPTAG